MSIPTICNNCEEATFFLHIINYIYEYIIHNCTWIYFIPTIHYTCILVIPLRKCLKLTLILTYRLIVNKGVGFPEFRGHQILYLGNNYKTGQKLPFQGSGNQMEANNKLRSMYSWKTNELLVKKESVIFWGFSHSPTIPKLVSSCSSTGVG